MGDINHAMNRMLYWVRDANLGYGQDTRTHIWPGGAADCSSLVIHVLKEAGFDTGYAYYTGDMYPALTSKGWRSVPISQRQPGDVLLTPNDHVALLLHDGNTVGEAYINEIGRITGGRDGDQTGSETRTAHYSYRSWRYCLRAPGGGGTAGAVPGGTGGGRAKTEEELEEEELMSIKETWLRPMWDKLVFMEGVLTDTKINWVQPTFQRVKNCETRLAQLEAMAARAEKDWLKHIWDKGVQINGTTQSLKDVVQMIEGVVNSGTRVNGQWLPGLRPIAIENQNRINKVTEELKAARAEMESLRSEVAKIQHLQAPGNVAPVPPVEPPAPVDPNTPALPGPVAP